MTLVMTTTKKKAKRSTRVTGMAADVAEMGAEVVRLGRVSAALEGIYKIHMLSRFEALSRRIEALEQAQRPAECGICHGDGIYVSPSLGSEIECPNCGPSVSREPPEPTPAAPAAPSEESRLRDAVVEAALAWFSAGEDLGPGQKQESMMTAIVALRAHRAKKGGACCERDTDKDGECPRHPRNPGQFFNKGGT